MTRAAFPILVLSVAGAVLPPPEEPLPTPAPSPAREEPSAALAAELEADAYLLAQVATGEDPKAAAAVTWVVLNRAGCQVAPLRCRVPVLQEVKKHRAFGTMKGGRWHPAWTPGRSAHVRVLAEVVAVLDGRIPDPTRGATHFHRVGTWTPPWAPPSRFWTRHGSHSFYKSR